MSHQGTIYRPHIDGLRAIAILSVMLYHASATLVPGGFIGVDIFFVISGFLITRNILGDLEQGRFSLLEFYRRRIKRIAPAMLVVVAATLVVTQFIMLPEAAEKTAESAAWSVASFANVYFWRHTDTSYFAAGNDEMPLLHLWSLGVEEQFYFLWPLLLMMFFRRRWLSLAIVVTALASISLAEYLFPTSPNFTYYMLPTRAGELLAGALLARLDLAGMRLNARFASIAGWLGLALVGVSLWLIREDDVFPGVLCLPPVIGAALLIMATEGPVARALSLPAIRWIGLVSYSAYLWHWPILALWRYGHATITLTAGAALIAAIFALAWLSYTYVELPARASKANWLRVVGFQFAVPGLAIVLVCGVAMKLDGYGLRHFTGYPAQLESVRQARRPAYEYEYVCQRQRLTASDVADSRCVVGAGDAAPVAALWGDSNAAHYVGMVGAFARAAGYRVRNLEHGSCPPLDGDPQPYVTARRLDDCRASLDVARPVVEQFHTVILSASWPTYYGRYEDQFQHLVERLSAERKRVIVIGRVPPIDGYEPRCAEKALSYPTLRCEVFRAQPSAEAIALNARLRAWTTGLANVTFFDPVEYLCPGGVCTSTDDGGRVVYYDHEHLSMEASWRLGERILSRSGLPESFRIDGNAMAAQLTSAGAH